MAEIQWLRKGTERRARGKELRDLETKNSVTPWFKKNKNNVKNFGN